MYTCKVCNYTLTIGKVTSQNNPTVIDSPLEFIRMFVKSRSKKISMDMDIDTTFELPFELDSMIAQLNKNGYDEEVNKSLTEKFTNIKRNMRPNTFCLKCTQCNEDFVLPVGKIMSIKLKKTYDSAILNIEDIINDYTFPRTKDFICSNKNCTIHDHRKEAVLYRPNPNEYTTNYICVNCNTIS